MDELRGRHLQGALETRGVIPIVAVFPDQLAELPRTLKSLKDAGLTFGLWPMLENDKGRWLSSENVGPFLDFCNRLVGITFDKGVAPESLVLDVEPPIADMQGWWKPRRNKRSKELAGHALSTHPLGDLKNALNQLEIDLHVAVLPLLALDNDKASLGWQSKLKAPNEWNRADVIHVMTYTTLFRGYSKGLLSRKDALRILDYMCSSSKDLFLERAAMSLGCVGQGALGDEAVFKSPQELAKDVGLVKTKGVSNIAVFDLGGMVRRGPVAVWLDALTKTPASNQAYEMNLKIQGLKKVAGFLGRRFSP